MVDGGLRRTGSVGFKESLRRHSRSSPDRFRSWPEELVCCALHAEMVMGRACRRKTSMHINMEGHILARFLLASSGTGHGQSPPASPLASPMDEVRGCSAPFLSCSWVHDWAEQAQDRGSWLENATAFVKWATKERIDEG